MNTIWIEDVGSMHGTAIRRGQEGEAHTSNRLRHGMAEELVVGNTYVFGDTVVHGSQRFRPRAVIAAELSWSDAPWQGSPHQCDKANTFSADYSDHDDMLSDDYDYDYGYYGGPMSAGDLESDPAPNTWSRYTSPSQRIYRDETKLDSPDGRLTTTDISSPDSDEMKLPDKNVLVESEEPQTVDLTTVETTTVEKTTVETTSQPEPLSTPTSMVLPVTVVEQMAPRKRSLDEVENTEGPAAKYRKKEVMTTTGQTNAGPSFIKYAAAALAGSAVGAVGTIVGLAALPADYFTSVL
jgi:hypothetical protein